MWAEALKKFLVREYLGLLKNVPGDNPHLVYYFVIKNVFGNIMHRCTLVENLGRGS